MTTSTSRISLLFNGSLVRRLVVGMWLCTLVVWLLLTAAQWAFSSDTDCELSPGSSVYGEAGRSWLPPGQTCTYDLGQPGLEPFEIDPGVASSVLPAALIAGALGYGVARTSVKRN